MILLKISNGLFHNCYFHAVPDFPHGLAVIEDLLRIGTAWDERVGQGICDSLLELNQGLFQIYLILKNRALVVDKITGLL